MENLLARPMIVDYHMHLRGPTAGGSEPLVLTRRDGRALRRDGAPRRGVDEIGFTEHVYYFRQTRDVWFLPYHLERCVVRPRRLRRRRARGEAAGACRSSSGSRSTTSASARTSWRRSSRPTRSTSSSARCTRCSTSPSTSSPGVWERAAGRGGLARLLRHALRARARAGTSTCMAHPDLAKIYGERPRRRCWPSCTSRVAVELRPRRGVAVEISTAGLRKPVGEIYPDESLPRRLPAARRADHHRLRRAHADLVGHELDRPSSSRAASGTRRSRCSRGERAGRSRSGNGVPLRSVTGSHPAQPCEFGRALAVPRAG